MQKLRQKLLDTDYFVSNHYLEKYLDLVSKPSANALYTEQHHILPRAYSRLIGKKSPDDSKSNLVKLSFVDHCRAHYYLYHCTKGKLKKSMAIAYVTMVGDWSKLKEELSAEEYLVLEQQRKQIIKDSSYYWTEDEIAYVKTNYRKLTKQEIAINLNRTFKSVEQQINRLRLSDRLWTAQQEEYLKANWSLKTATQIAVELGKTRSAVNHKVARLGLTK